MQKTHAFQFLKLVNISSGELDQWLFVWLLSNSSILFLTSQFAFNLLYGEGFFVTPFR